MKIINYENIDYHKCIKCGHHYRITTPFPNQEGDGYVDMPQVASKMKCPYCGQDQNDKAIKDEG